MPHWSISTPLFLAESAYTTSFATVAGADGRLCYGLNLVNAVDCKTSLPVPVETIDLRHSLSHQHMGSEGCL